jgi:hypothetical protein
MRADDDAHVRAMRSLRSWRNPSGLGSERNRAFILIRSSTYVTSALSWRELDMSNAENLRKIFHEVQTSGKFETYEFIAILSNLIDIADRLERVEIACKIEGS